MKPFSLTLHIKISIVILSNKWYIYVFTITCNHITKRNLITITISRFIWINITTCTSWCWMTNQWVWARRMMNSIWYISLWRDMNVCNTFFEYHHPVAFFEDLFLSNPTCLDYFLSWLENPIFQCVVTQGRTFSWLIQFFDLVFAW